MKERPILFSGPMVRAILEGRKTQTRRIVKPKRDDGAICGSADEPAYAIEQWGGGKWNCAVRTECIPCPYGQPGDRLWVKETFCRVGDDYAYRVDNWTDCPADDDKWKPSIFCTRAASRITLKVSAVRVERLQDISEADADAEGALNSSGLHDFDCEGKCFHADQRCDCGSGSIAKAYKRLWESINGAGSWAENPWVWVVEFRRITP